MMESFNGQGALVGQNTNVGIFSGDPAQIQSYPLLEAYQIGRNTQQHSSEYLHGSESMCLTAECYRSINLQRHGEF